MTKETDALSKVKKQDDFSEFNLGKYDWKFIGKSWMTIWNNETTLPKETQFFVTGFGTADAKLLALQTTSFDGNDVEFRWQVSNLLHICGEMDYESNLKGFRSKVDN